MTFTRITIDPKQMGGTPCIRSLRIPVEIPAEVDRIKHSLHLDPDKVRTYFDTLSANWPTQFPEPSSD